MERLYICKDEEVIERYLLEIMKDKASVIIWTNYKEKKVPLLGNIFNVKKKEFLVNFKDKVDDKIRSYFEGGDAVLFFRSPHKSVLFHPKLSWKDENTALIKIPDEIRVMDKREDRRYNAGFLFDDTIKFSIETTYKLHQKHHQAKIMDVSKRGVSFIISSYKSAALTVGKEIMIKQIGNIKLPPNLRGYIRHVHEYNKLSSAKKSDYMRMGVELSKEIKFKVS